MERKAPFILRSDEESAKRYAAISRVEQLVAEGHSRLTAQRIVEIEDGRAEAGRARRHPPSRQ